MIRKGYEILHARISTTIRAHVQVFRRRLSLSRPNIHPHSFVTPVQGKNGMIVDEMEWKCRRLELGEQCSQCDIKKMQRTLGLQKRCVDIINKVVSTVTVSSWGSLGRTRTRLLLPGTKESDWKMTIDCELNNLSYCCPLCPVSNSGLY